MKLRVSCLSHARWASGRGHPTSSRHLDRTAKAPGAGVASNADVEMLVAALIMRVSGGLCAHRDVPSMEGLPSWSVAKRAALHPPSAAPSSSSQLQKLPQSPASADRRSTSQKGTTASTPSSVSEEKRSKPPAEVGLHPKSQFLSTLGRTIKKRQISSSALTIPDFASKIFLLFFCGFRYCNRCSTLNTVV